MAKLSSEDVHKLFLNILNTTLAGALHRTAKITNLLD